MTKVLVLGHKGMLGNIACTYLGQKGFELLTTDARWGDENYKDTLLSLAPDFIINCIGLIPQRKPFDEEYKFINTDLPIFLDTLGIKVIHPTTDQEPSAKCGRCLRQKQSRRLAISRRIRKEFKNHPHVDHRS
jgi:dTDP-4-dehydrorhamnose reductase